MVGVIIVEDFSAPLTDIERGCHGAVNRSAVAAENSLIALVRVGAPAEYDLKVTKIFFSVQTTQIVHVRVPTAGLTGLTVSANSTFTEQSLNGRPSSQLASNTQVGIPAGRDVFLGRVMLDTVIQLDVEIRIGTIGRGDDLTSIIIAADSVNTGLTGGFVWTESDPQG